MASRTKALTSRERISETLAHREPDLIPFDLGGFEATGVHVTTVYNLRQVLGLDGPGTPVKVIEPYMMLGEIKQDLVELLGIDVLSVKRKTNIFGFENSNWKPWRFHGVPVLVPERFNISERSDGSTVIYPQGDTDAPPCAMMPKDGYYFDSIIHQNMIEDDLLDINENLEEFSVIDNEELVYLENTTAELYSSSNRALMANFGGTSFGDIALVPGPMLKNPKGIRDVEEWYVSLLTRRDYIYKVFEKQCEIALINLGKIFSVVKNKIAVVVVSGADFGMQTGLFLRPEVYRDLFKPFHIKVNAWIHRNTNWKTFIHTCGSMADLLDDLIEAGFDILNPVQCSASNMEPQMLKKKYGKKLSFWGGGIDSKTLQMGTALEVKAEIVERMDAFKKDGGFVFSVIHNIQPNIPKENLLTMFKTFEENRRY
jgi:hypothetical protein